jgi:sugar phosphate isomerase/epimerase
LLDSFSHLKFEALKISYRRNPILHLAQELGAAGVMVCPHRALTRTSFLITGEHDERRNEEFQADGNDVRRTGNEGENENIVR